MSVSKRTQQEITLLYQRNVDAVWRVCFSYMKNQADTQDMVQATFLKLLAHEPVFESLRHERAWLIVTASNLCRDALKHWWRRREDIDQYPLLSVQTPQPDEEMLCAVLSLPPRYKDAVYLYYYEGYSTKEIAQMCRCAQSTVCSRLKRARGLLKERIRR